MSAPRRGKFTPPAPSLTTARVSLVPRHEDVSGPAPAPGSHRLRVRGATSAPRSASPRTRPSVSLRACHPHVRRPADAQIRRQDSIPLGRDDDGAPPPSGRHGGAESDPAKRQPPRRESRLRKRRENRHRRTRARTLAAPCRQLPAIPGAGSTGARDVGCRGANPVSRRQPAAVHQVGAALGSTTRGRARGGRRAHRPALRPRAVRVFFEELGLAPSPHTGSASAAAARRDARTRCSRRSRRPSQRAARCGAGLRGHELDACRSASGRAHGLPVAHVEAGLRSGDWSMPEEHNRVETDRIAALLLCPDERSARHPGRRGESGAASRSLATSCYDAADRLAPIARRRSSALERFARRARRLRRRDDPPRGERRAGAAGARSSTRLPRWASPSSSPHTRAPARCWRRPATSRRQHHADRAARLPRPRSARLAGARDRHRLGRAPEGGLLVRRALRDRTALDGMGRHGRARRERAGRRRRGRARRSCSLGAAAGEPARASTATGGRRKGSQRRCLCSRAACRRQR